MGIDIFSESARAYEQDNKDKVVLIIDKSLLKRFNKACKKQKWDCDIEQFIGLNLEMTGN